MKAHFRLFAAALAVVFGLSALGIHPAHADKVKLTIGTWTGVDEAKEFQAVIDKVNAASTTFEVAHAPNPANYYDQLQTQLAGGTGPDLMWLDQEHIAGYADSGVLLDITDRVAKADKGSAADLSDYFPDVMQTAQLNGKTYGLPWIAQPVMLYYNKALFDAAGVKYPDDSWTWDTFRDTAAKLTISKDGKIAQYGTAFNGWPPVQMFIWQAGGDVISADRASSPIDTPEALAGINYYASIIFNEKYSPSEATMKEQGFAEMFKAGKIAMFMGGAADDLDRVPGLNVGIARVPKGPKNRTTFTWTASTLINAATKHPDEAYQALVALTEGIQHWKILAPRKSLATADVLSASEPRKKDSAAVIVTAAADMRSKTNLPRQAEWDDKFWSAYQDPIYHGKAKAEDIAKKVRADLEALLPKK